MLLNNVFFSPEMELHFLFQGKRERSEAAHLNNQNPTEVDCHVQYILERQRCYDKLRNLCFLTLLLCVKSVKSKKTFF